MRRLATIVIAATMLPVFGASPEEPQFSITLPFNVDLALPGFSEKGVKSAVDSRTAGRDVVRVSPSTCYYMGQINKNLQKPKEKPELVQLADADASPVPGNVNCLTRSLEPGTAGR